MRTFLPFVFAAAALAACSDDSATAPQCDGGGDDPAGVVGPSRDPMSVLLVEGDPGQCPANPLSEALGGTCVYRVECQGSTVDFSLGPGWTASSITEPATCAHPFDSCPALNLHCRYGSWNHAGGLDEPGECDWTPPGEGDGCQNPSAATSDCGYWCYGAEGGSWTVASCVLIGEDTRLGTWQFDRTCPCR